VSRANTFAFRRPAPIEGKAQRIWHAR
jgi:hypothetical protein